MIGAPYSKAIKKHVFSTGKKREKALRRILTSDLINEPEYQEILYLWLQDAFEHLKFFQRGTLSPEDKKEIMHRSFIAILDAYPRYCNQKKATSWLLQICTNTGRNFLRLTYYRESQMPPDQENLQGYEEASPRRSDFVIESFLKLYHIARSVGLGEGLYQIEKENTERFWSVLEKAKERFVVYVKNIKNKKRVFKLLAKALAETSGDDSFLVESDKLFLLINERYKKQPNVGKPK